MKKAAPAPKPVREITVVATGERVHSAEHKHEEVGGQVGECRVCRKRRVIRCRGVCRSCYSQLWRKVNVDKTWDWERLEQIGAVERVYSIDDRLGEMEIRAGFKRQQAA